MAAQIYTYQFAVFPMMVAFAAIWRLRGDMRHFAAFDLCSYDSRRFHSHLAEGPLAA